MRPHPHVPAARGRMLTVFAVLFALLAVSNFLKPFQIGGERTGFVFLGRSVPAMRMAASRFVPFAPAACSPASISGTRAFSCCLR